MTSSGIERNDIFALRKLADSRSLDALILDLDGTFRLEGRWLDGALEFFDSLQRLGLPHLILTNDATMFSVGKAAQLSTSGLRFDSRYVLTCADLTIDMMHKRGFREAVVLGRLGDATVKDLDLQVFPDGIFKSAQTVILGSGTRLDDGLLTSWSRNSPQYCLIPNADLVWLPRMDEIALCPGLVGHALRVLSSALNQRVEFIECGKPSAFAFESAVRRLGEVWSRSFVPGRIGVFGDSHYSDLAPAKHFGFVPIQSLSGLWRFDGER